MSITAPPVPDAADPNGGADRPEAVSWLPALVDAIPGANAMLFDRNLTIMAAGGPAWVDLDAPPEAGRRLADVLPRAVIGWLDPHLGALFDGQAAEFDYTGPRSRRDYQVTCRPVAGPDGTVRAGMLVCRDVTEDRWRRELLTEIQRVGRIGCAAYERHRGWHADPELLALLELSMVEQVLTGLVTIVLEPDRARVTSAMLSVLTNGGRQTLHYRIRRPRSQDVRHVLCSVLADVDGPGRLVRATIVHVDVTLDMVGEELVARATRDRTRLLRRVSDVLAQHFPTHRVSVERAADVAAATLGGTTLVRVVGLHQGTVDLDLLAVADDARAHEIPESIHDAVRAWVPTASSVDPHDPSARPYSSLDNPGWRADYQRQTGRPIPPAVAHFISVPIRHDGTVLGFMRAFRVDDQPFAAGDDDLLQVIADHVGGVLAEGRVREQLERQGDEGRGLADRLGRLLAEQRDLLAQLDTVEERERLLLAEAMHDEPLQLIVAATMRLDAMAPQLGPRAREAEELIAILEEAVRRLRTMITALTPPRLTDGLGMAFRRLADAVFVVDRSVAVEVTGDDHVSLSPSRKMNACRILREGLVYARTHARATQIWLDLTEADGLVTATLRDNGVGAIDLDAGPGHLAIATMQGRAAAEDGRLEVVSAPGTGTTIVLTVPVNAPAVRSAGARSPAGDEPPATW